MNKKRPTVDEMFEAYERERQVISQMTIPPTDRCLHRFTRRRRRMVCDLVLVVVSLVAFVLGCYLLVTIDGDTGDRVACLIAVLLTVGCLVASLTLCVQHHRHPLYAMEMNEAGSHFACQSQRRKAFHWLGLSGLVALMFLLLVPIYSGRSFCGDGQRALVLANIESLLSKGSDTNC